VNKVGTWSIAAALLAVGALILGVVWFVQRNQEVRAGAESAPSASDVQAPGSHRAIAERSAEGSSPAGSAAPLATHNADEQAATDKQTDKTTAETETVDLDELPILPNGQFDIAKYRVEQAKQATKLEMADEAATGHDSSTQSATSTVP
jgi:hypothetical protein